MKVLIVDDRADMRRMIRSFIKDQADDVAECDDGAEVVENYRKHDPDFVLMDLRMKKVDGFTATTNLRAAFPNARVVIVSQWDSPALRERARRVGASAYINKDDLRPLRDLLMANRNMKG